jgi:ribosome recycling factor
MDGAKKLQKQGKITEDELERSEKEIQKLTDKQVDSIDKHVSVKEAELMTV